MDGLEYSESVLLANYLSDLQEEGKILRFTHVPNETYTKYWNIKMKNLRMGVKKGFPDYIILFTDKIACLEMKRVKGGITSPEQKEWIADLNSLGIPAKVCNGYAEAKVFIDELL